MTASIPRMRLPEPWMARSKRRMTGPIAYPMAREDRMGPELPGMAARERWMGGWKRWMTGRERWMAVREHWTAIREAEKAAGQSKTAAREGSKRVRER